MCLKNCGYKFDIYRDWFLNQSSDKDEEFLMKEWYSFQKDGLNFGSLINIVKEYNLEGYL